MLIRYPSLLTTFLQHLFIRTFVLYSEDLQTTTVLFTQRIFTQDWLNYYYSSSSLSCLFIGLRKQSDELSWSRMFVFRLSREFYRDFIAVCVFCTYCCLCILYTLPLVISLFHTHAFCFCNFCCFIFVTIFSLVIASLINMRRD